MEEGKILVLFFVHLTLGTRCLVLLSAQVENTVNYHSQHLLAGGSAIEAGIVPYRLDIYKDVAGDVTLFEIALVEGDDVGEVVVAEELDIHLSVSLCRAEDIGDFGNLIATLLYRHFTQPTANKPLLWQTITARIVIEHYIHTTKIGKIVLIGKFCTALRSGEFLTYAKYAADSPPRLAQNFLNQSRFSTALRRGEYKLYNHFTSIFSPQKPFKMW